MNTTKSLGLYLCVFWACLYGCQSEKTNKMSDIRNEAERVLEIETGVVQPIIQAAFNSAFVCFHAVFRPSSQGFPTQTLRRSGRNCFKCIFVCEGGHFH